MAHLIWFAGPDQLIASEKLFIVSREREIEVEKVRVSCRETPFVYIVASYRVNGNTVEESS